jgi:hypothetical protein
MVTRLYLPNQTGPDPSISPAFSATWGGVANAIRGIPNTAKEQNTTLASNNSALYVETSASAINVLHQQFVSVPLNAQVISGTYSAVVRGGSDASTALASLQAVLKVVSNDGATVRGTLYAGHSAAANSTAGALGQNWATATQTRIIPAGTALTTVTAQAGDRLVIELGHRFTNTTTTSQGGWMVFGDTTAVGDFALTAGLTTSLNPWLELSGDISFQGGAVAQGYWGVPL